MTEKESSKSIDYFGKYSMKIKAMNQEEEEIIEEVKSLIQKKVEENTFMNNEDMERIFFKIMVDFAVDYIKNKKEKEKVEKIFKSIFMTLNRELK